MPDDARTITVVQGRGTALYTPLEQYGGDGGHTDVRTDIFSLGATFFHLLSNYPPPDAKARFLNPRVLKPLNEINNKISFHVSEAVLWAIEMHPDNRPNSIEQFRKVLMGEESRPLNNLYQPSQPGLAESIKSNRITALVAFGLLILAIIITIV